MQAGGGGNRKVVRRVQASAPRSSADGREPSWNPCGPGIWRDSRAAARAIHRSEPQGQPKQQERGERSPGGTHEDHPGTFRDRNAPRTGWLRRDRNPLNIWNGRRRALNLDQLQGSDARRRRTHAGKRQQQHGSQSDPPKTESNGRRQSASRREPERKPHAAGQRATPHGPVCKSGECVHDLRSLRPASSTSFCKRRSSFAPMCLSSKRLVMSNSGEPSKKRRNNCETALRRASLRRTNGS